MKNTYLLLLSLCLYLLTLLFSCEIIETNDTADSYFPLKVGYYWKYVKTYSMLDDDYQKKFYPDTIITRIIGTTNINNHTYFLIEKYSLYIPWDTVLARNEGYNVFSFNPNTGKEDLIYNFKQDNDTLRMTNYFNINNPDYLRKSFSGEEVIFTWHIGYVDRADRIIERFYKVAGRIKISSYLQNGARTYDLIQTNVTNYKKNN